ncbi:transposable element Tc1 transposase [Trichonephila clavipes]|nr:transposable element Tc1 transposase [Trichonephila clavipes]
MFHRRIQTHYVQLSEFQRGRIIGLNDARPTNWRIARHMGRIDSAIRRCWQKWFNNGRFQRYDVFSYESHFRLCPDDHRRRVWRRPGQRADPAFTIACPTGSQPGDIIWVAISFGSRTPLVVFRGTLTAQRYFEDILRTVFLPFLFPGLFFQQDNVRSHTERIAMNCLTDC